MNLDHDLAAFRLKVRQRLLDVHVQSYLLALESVTEGSAITSAPGQPVDTANLKGSWPANSHIVGPMDALVITNVDYAPAVEEGIGPHGPMTLRSPVGGFHSVAITRANWQRIVNTATARVVQ